MATAMFALFALLCGPTTTALQTGAPLGVQLPAALEVAMSGDALEVHQVLTLGAQDEQPMWRAENARLGLVATFESEGVSVELDGANGIEPAFRLQLETWGPPSAPTPVRAPEFTARGASILLDRGSVLEWYVNGVDGLQQGFTVLEAPAAGDAANGLELRMRWESELALELRGGRDLVLRDGCGAARVELAGLRAWDATGRELDVSYCAAGEWLSILVDSSGASYPLTIDPLVSTFEAKLVPPAGAALKWIGSRVDIDGDTAVAVGVQNSFSGRAKAYIFVRDPAGWTRQAVVSSQGVSFSLGDAVLVGDRVAFANNPYENMNGCYYVYARNAGVWSIQDAGCTASCCTSFGQGLSLTNNRLAFTNDEGGINNGKILRFIASGWITEFTLPPVGYVALRDDLAVVTTNPAPYWSNPQLRVYQRVGTTWSLLATPMNLPDGSYPVAIDEEHTIAVGAPNISGSGVVHLLRRTGSSWTLWQTIVSPDPASATEFGAALGFESGLLAVGCRLDDTAGVNAGAAYVFQRNGDWQLARKVLAPDAAPGDQFGADVALEDKRLVVGAPFDVHPGGATGSAYVFTLELDALVYCTAKVNSVGCLPAIAFNGRASASSSAPFTISAQRVINQKNGVFFYGTGGRAATPFDGAYRCVATPVKRAGWLFSAGNLGPNDCSGVLSLDFNAYLQSGADPALSVGSVVNGQFWYRDGAAASGTGLSDGIEFEIAP